MLSRKHLDSQELMLRIAGPRCKSHFIYMPSSNCSKCRLRTRTMDFKGRNDPLHPNSLDVLLRVRCINDIAVNTGKEIAPMTWLHQGGLQCSPEHAIVPWGPLQNLKSDKALAKRCRRRPRKTRPHLLPAWGLYRQRYALACCAVSAFLYNTRQSKLVHLS